MNPFLLFRRFLVLCMFSYGATLGAQQGASLDPSAQNETTHTIKSKEEFRDYEQASDRVKAFYRLQHTHQTLEFAQKKRKEYQKLDHGQYSVWEVLQRLSQVVDESDPDLDLPQIQHAMQVAQAIRQDGHPDWMVLAGLIHDAGKLLAIWGEPQWAVVGDTYPLGCQFSDKIVYPEYFQYNPDSQDPRYNTPLGIYTAFGQNIGLKNVVMTWGHDEYLYQVIKDQSTLPKEAKFIIRFHSFYALHKENEYQFLLDEEDKKYLPWVKRFNQYDLYSKSIQKVDVEQLRPFYQALIAKYFPEKIRW